MTLLPPGSGPWLLHHELRLAWRRLGGVHSRIWAGLGLLVWLAFHGVPYLLLRMAGSEIVAPGLSLVLGAALWFVFALMLSHAITLAVDVLFDRGDLDLLLASPTAPAAVFLVRGLGVAIACVTLYAVLLTPFAHAGLATGHLRLLAIYPALAAMALLAAASGMALTLLLVRGLGARRARTAAQLLGAFVGAGFFLAAQAGSVFGDERVASWIAAVRHASEGSVAAQATGLVRLPFAAMVGELPALAVLVLAGFGAFALVVAATGRHFLAGTQESVTDAALAAEPGGPVAPFRSGLWRVVLVKEWKLIRRDPQLIGQTLLPVLYLLPMIFIWGRQSQGNPVFVPAVVLAATTLASGLAWVTVAAEDAPELVAAAPVALEQVRRIKLAAALLPVWFLVAPLLVHLALGDARVAFVFAVCVLGSTISVGLVHLEVSKPGDRRKMRRRGSGNWLGGVLEGAVALSWAALAWCLLAAPLFAPVAAAAAFAAPLAAMLIGRSRRGRASPP